LEKIQNLAAVEEISDYLIEMNDALQGMPAHRVDPAIAVKIGNGVLLRPDELMAGARLQDASHLKILDPDNNLLAVLEYRKDEPFLKYCCVLNA
jgi:hypothetical protein